jgi:hypothetical protein
MIASKTIVKLFPLYLEDMNFLKTSKILSALFHKMCLNFQMLRNYRVGRLALRSAGGMQRRQEMVPLGRTSKPETKYKIGQHFIHNQMNYRGLILFSIPHQRYVYDQETKDYSIHEEVI